MSTTINLTVGADGKIPVTLKKDGKIEPLNLNLPGGDFIKFLIPGSVATILKKLDNATADEVIIDSNDCGEFHAVITEADLLKGSIAGEFQNFVVKIKRGTEDIIKEFDKGLFVNTLSLTEPAP